MLPENEHQFLMKDYLNNEIQNTLPTLLKLGVLDVPDTPIETYIHTVKSGDPSKLPFLLEFFENIFSKNEREIINPLIEQISLDERSEIGHLYFKSLPTNLDQELIDNLNKIMIKSDKINDSTNWLPILRVHPNGNLFLEWEKI